jgi:non-heme chloroperoxidase
MTVQFSRRSVLIGGMTVLATTLPGLAEAINFHDLDSKSDKSTNGGQPMSSITTKDGIEIFYKDWGKGQPIVFSHGWPLTADDWDAQMLFFGQQGYRVIAHDRRGHGRSTQTWEGNDMDTYADDLAQLTEKLDLKNAIHVGHSTGGGEVARYIGRHGTKRVAAAALIGAVPPLMLKTAANPGGTPIEAFDAIRAGVPSNRAQFYKDLTLPFYGYNRPGATVSEGVREHWWLQGIMGGIKAHVKPTHLLKWIGVSSSILTECSSYLPWIAQSWRFDGLGGSA